MSILHRIFVSKHKHKKIFRKRAYKKFIGLKTFKNVVYTQLCLPFQPSAIKKPIKKIIIKKPAVKRKSKSFRFRILKFLSPRLRRQEVACAQRDVENFKNIAAMVPEEKIPEEKFQAFLPHKVWAKMTYEQRGAHMRKRKALAAQQKENRRAESRRYAFSDKHLRPAVRSMHSTGRRKYLKRLIKFAHTSSQMILAPSDVPGMAAASTTNTRLAIRRGKKRRTRIRDIYKDITCTSVTPEGLNLVC